MQQLQRRVLLLGITLSFLLIAGCFGPDPYDSSEISTEMCKPQVTEQLSNGDFNVTTNLISGSLSMETLPLIEVQRRNGPSLYMQPTVGRETNYDQDIDTIKNRHDSPQLDQYLDTRQDDEGNIDARVLDLGADEQTISIDYDAINTTLQEACDDNLSYCGDNTVTLYLVPIDPRCSFNGDNSLDSEEFNTDRTDIGNLLAYDLIITENKSDFNLAESLGNPEHVKPYHVKIEDDVTIFSTSSEFEHFAFSTGRLPEGSSLELLNLGSIQGKGGDGGVSMARGHGQPGSRGGHALELFVPTTINNSQGTILSGGGGGGAGGSYGECSDDNDGRCSDWEWKSGGAGGGGIGNLPGEGGNLIQRIERDDEEDDDDDEDGSFHNQKGEVATVITPGDGGQGQSSEAGNGGAGGDWGERGESGETAFHDDDDIIRLMEGGAGGKPGYAVVSYGLPLDWEGGPVNVEGNINTSIQVRTLSPEQKRFIVGSRILTNGTVFLDRNRTPEEISLPEKENNKNIKIYKNGTLVEERNVDPQQVALQAHRLGKARSAKEAERFVNESSRLMNKFEIIKNLSFDESSNKTDVEIKLRNIPASERKNITIYQIIPKSVAGGLYALNFTSDGGGKRFVLEKDPVIGWHFNDSDGSESVSYETPGENEGGEIIVTQEPILFNEGELIVKYRETNCTADEATLFELDDIENSNVLKPGSGGLFKVCLGHISEPLYRNDDASLHLHLFNHSQNGNVSVDASRTYQEPVGASVNNDTSIYWDFRISRGNPNGNYSCIGSIENKGSSRMGDCGWTKKRLWVHLGADYHPPNTTLDYPYLAHSVNVNLNATDNIGGSGVANTYYCVDSNNACNPNQEYNGSFSITCPEDWGCTKYVRFYSTDKEGNQEPVNSYPLSIIEKGSACEADCTAKPTPDRYLEVCQNLNSCSFYDYEGDGGDRVAERCNFLSKGAYVQLNGSHEVKCPDGPIREKTITNEDFSISNDECASILTIPFLTLIEGRPTTMRMMFCQREQN